MNQYQVSFGEAISRAFNNYSCFQGRASRSEFWFFFLFILLGVYALAAVGGMIGFCMGSVLPSIFFLATLLPSLGLSWRRMHDIGKGGGYYFISWIPIVGQIIYIIWCCRPSEPMTNRFGEMPNLEAK